MHNSLGALFNRFRTDCPVPLSTRNYTIYYVLSRPSHGRGHGADGVRGKHTVAEYADCLERCHAHLESFGRRCQNAPKTEVVICNVPHYCNGDYSATIRLGEPRLGILLPTQIPGRTAKEQRVMMESCAIHECVHLFNLHERPFGISRDKLGWDWFDEATATFYEYFLGTDRLSWLAFATPAQQHPERLLQNGPGYQGCVLVGSLQHHYGLELVHRIWTESSGATSCSDPKEEASLTVLEAIAEHLGGIGHFFSDAKRPDFFANRFCVGSYFSDMGAAAGGMLQHVARRGGQGAVRNSAPLPAGGILEWSDKLAGIGCLHFRILGSEDVSSVSIEFETTGSGRKRLLKAIASETEPGRTTRGKSQERPIRCVSLPDQRFDRGQLEIPVFEIGGTPSRGLIITVVHGGFRAGMDRMPVEFKVVARRQDP